MSLVWALLLVVAVSGTAIAALLFVRRGAPDGGYFTNGDRAAGVFGMLTTALALLLGFVVFLAFESFDDSRSGAETEANTVAQQFETALLMPAGAQRELANGLECYARSVVGQEWPRMRGGNEGNTVNPWGAAMFKALRRVNPVSNSQQSAYDAWLGQTSAREQARSDRIHGAEGVIPTAVWAALLVMAVAVIGFMLLFADSGERRVVQAAQIGGVAAFIVISLLVIRFLDSPFHRGAGGLDPVAMERTLDLLEQGRRLTHTEGPLPCDALGRPAPAS